MGDPAMLRSVIDDSVFFFPHADILKRILSFPGQPEKELIMQQDLISRYQTVSASSPYITPGKGPGM
jgi:hypothetical protein